MRIDERTRLDLRRAFEELIGPELAAAAMEAMPNIEYDDLATKADLAELRLATTADMTRTRVELRGEMTELRSELRVEMTELRADVRSEIGELRGEVTTLGAELRTEMAQMHGALERRMAANVRTTLLTHVGSIFAVAGVFAGFS